MKIQIHYWAINRLVPSANHLRKNDHAVDQISNAIREFGFRVPLIVKSDGTVIDGDLRLKAASRLGLAEVPVVLADDMTEEQIKAFRISVNRMAELANWDLDLLKVELQELDLAGYDMALTGLDEATIGDLLQAVDPTDGLTDPDEVPDLQTIPVSRPGDLWQLGNHRLLCGDSTSIAQVKKLMDGELADMVFTDPPYNVAYEGKTAAKLTIQNDNMDSAAFATFLRDAFSAMAAGTKTGGAFYVCHADSEVVNFRLGLLAGGWLIKQTIIWVKNQFILGRQDYQWQHEPILYGWRDGSAHKWYGDRKQSTVLDGLLGVTVENDQEGELLCFSDGKMSAVLRVPSYDIVRADPDDLTTIWRVDKPQRNDEHPTMKPVSLVSKAITNSSRSGDRVLDPFGGSGSTLIACEKTGRRARLMELDPKYCDVIVRRWQRFTGQQAVLEGEGIAFDQLAKDVA